MVERAQVERGCAAECKIMRDRVRHRARRGSSRGDGGAVEEREGEGGRRPGQGEVRRGTSHSAGEQDRVNLHRVRAAEVVGRRHPDRSTAKHERERARRRRRRGPVAGGRPETVGAAAQPGRERASRCRAGSSHAGESEQCFVESRRRHNE